MSDTPDFLSDEPSSAPAVTPEAPAAPEPAPQEQPQACLLYTSDAADE